MVRVAGEDRIVGTLCVERDELQFRPGRRQAPGSGAWFFEFTFAGIIDVEIVERTLQELPWSLERGLRVRAVDGQEATFYLCGRGKGKADVVVRGLRTLVKHGGGLADAVPSTQPLTCVDAAANAPQTKSSEFSRWLQRHSWWIMAVALAFWIPELVTGLREGAGLLVLVYPGVWIAFSIHVIVGRFVHVTTRNHPLLAVLPLSSYLVGVSILAFVLVPFDGAPLSVAVVTLIFGIPAAAIAAMWLSPDTHRAWRKARENDERRSRGI